MVHYVRFLKPPRLHKIGDSQSLIKALITITTDLGEEFYPFDFALKADLWSEKDGASKPLETSNIQWNSGMRVLWVEVATAVHASLEWSLRVFSAESSTGSHDGDSIALERLPLVLGCSCKIDDPLRGPGGYGRSERRFILQPGNCLRIYEDIGESIARHIWDAGIATVAFLAHLKQCSSDRIKGSPFSSVIAPAFKRLNVLELGSGCGIAGIAFAQLWPQCQVFLTDLAEAMDILESNIAKSTPAVEAELNHVILDWEEELPIEIRNVTFDLVLVSDCTYNPDSTPSLVKTLSAISDMSSNVLIMISLKLRHPSEVVLFELLSGAGFSELSHTSFLLPNQDQLRTDQEQERVDVYEYQQLGNDHRT